VDNHVFHESSKSKISQWGLQKINYVDFIGIENFLSNFPKENLDFFFFIILEEILIFYDQEKIKKFWKKITDSEFMTIN
jgi:hypothetical protein